MSFQQIILPVTRSDIGEANTRVFTLSGTRQTLSDLRISLPRRIAPVEVRDNSIFRPPLRHREELLAPRLRTFVFADNPEAELIRGGEFPGMHDDDGEGFDEHPWRNDRPLIEVVFSSLWLCPLNLYCWRIATAVPFFADERKFTLLTTVTALAAFVTFSGRQSLYPATISLTFLRRRRGILEFSDCHGSALASLWFACCVTKLQNWLQLPCEIRYSPSEGCRDKNGEQKMR